MRHGTRRQGAGGGFRAEVSAGRRFEFGKNWSGFLRLVDEARIEEATRSLREMLGARRLDGLSFLDVGSGSGLFSLAARRLGARVFSFDYDPASVACTRELRRRHFDGDPEWSVAEGSILDGDFVRSLGRFDVVYAWGSLHHTGEMWRAVELAAERVGARGVLYTMIYLDRGWISVVWRGIKRAYCSSFLGRAVVVSVFVPWFAVRGLFEDLCSLRNPLRRYTAYRKKRGMSVLHDWIDWLGGYPFEFARPCEVIRFVEARGFVLQKTRATEYVFRRGA